MTELNPQTISLFLGFSDRVQCGGGGGMVNGDKRLTQSSDNSKDSSKANFQITIK